MSTSYQGSRIFEFLSNASGMPLDQINFIIGQIAAIILGFGFRAHLKPCPQNTLRRHLVSLLLGIMIGHFCFGKQMWHLFFQAFVSFVALEFCPRKFVHYFTFVFAIGYLSGVHIYRQMYDYGTYTLDITGPLMISTQKLTALAFAFYDGSKNDEELSPDQRQQAISYIFNFQGIICGPLVYYQDYIDFIDGNNILKKRKKNQTYDDDSSSKIVQPSVLQPVLLKLITCVAIAMVFFNVAIIHPIRSNLSGSQRSKYYLAWVLSDAVNNASGLGFNGYDEDDNPKWDLVTNINIFKLETSTSMKSIFDNWNIQTQLWLRRIAYDRLSTGKTLGVFVLSAFWHGFYPGYYMTFVLGAFYVYAGRGIRRKIRPIFQKNSVTIFLYACITWLCTLFAINYSVASFDLLELKLSIQIYNSFYWFVQIIVVIIALTLPGGSTKQKKTKTESTEIETAKKVE